jgi:uncharacterized protein DUF6223
MKKRNGILTGLIAACAACVISAASCSQSPQTSNKPTGETPMATASVRYIVDDVDVAIEFYAKLTELASVRYLIDDARAAVDFYTTHLGFTVDPAAGAIGITNGRARALVAAVVGLISLVIGGLALARSAGRIGAGNGRAGAIVALALGLIGMVLSVAHLGSSTGGFGTGGGRAGAIVALVLGLIGMNLGGLALARSRRSRTID